MKPFLIPSCPEPDNGYHAPLHTLRSAMKSFWSLLLLCSILCLSEGRAHPLDEGRQVIYVTLAPDEEGLSVVVTSQFDPEVSATILSTYDVNQDGAFSKDELDAYTEVLLENAVALVEVHAGKLNTFYQKHRTLPDNLVRFLDADQDGIISEEGYFSILASRMIEQYYLFQDHKGTRAFQIKAKESGMHAEILESAGQQIVKLTVEAKYPWPEGLKEMGVFAMKVDLLHRSVNISTSLGLLPVPDTITIHDRLNLAEEKPTMDWEAISQEGAFIQMPKVRRAILLMEIQDDPSDLLP